MIDDLPETPNPREQPALQAQIDDVQRQTDQRVAKAARLEQEIALLQARGETAAAQRRSLEVVREEIRVLRQRRAELEQQANQPPPGTPPDLVVGGIAQVAQNGGPSLELRTRPSFTDGGVIDRHPAGTQVTLLYGPEHVEGHIWWRVRRMDGREGWIVSDGLEGRPA